MAKVICSHVKSCGVVVNTVVDKNKNESVTSDCDHAIPHESDHTCINPICMRIAPTSISCVEIPA